MKFYAFGSEGGKYKLLLDHNTSNGIPWNSDGDNTKMKEVATQLALDTADWERNPRLITALEIVALTNPPLYDGKSYWHYFDGTDDYHQTQVSTEQGQSPYAWLYDYTKNCTSYGCDVADDSAFGYWTGTPAYDDIKAWNVSRSGILYDYKVTHSRNYGVRPVIELSKKLFANQIIK